MNGTDGIARVIAGLFFVYVAFLTPIRGATDCRRGKWFKHKEKFRVKKDSFLRKALPFLKDDKDDPFTYPILIPVFIYFVIAIISTLIFILYLIFPTSFIGTFLTSDTAFTIASVIVWSSIIYTCIYLSFPND